MRCASLAGLMAILSLATGAPPAAAQTLPRDLFLPPKRPVAPVTADSVAHGFNLSVAPLTTSRFHPPAPSAAESAQRPRPEPVRPINAEQVLAATAPLPPARPAAADIPRPEAEPIVITPKPIVTASVGPIARVEPLPNSAVIERANAYFTGLSTLVADFTQVGGDGRRMGGTLYLQRPGKVRFEYDPPATLEVIADGRSVAVRDRKLATQDLYSISQTPPKIPPAREGQSRPGHRRDRRPQ